MRELSSAPGFDPNEWQSPNNRFGNVLQMIREGATDEEISAKWPGVDGDVLRVYHAIVDGTTHEDPRDFDPDIEKEKSRKKERAFMDAYRRRYCDARRGVR